MPPTRRTPKPTQTQSSSATPLFVLVFGYPPEGYSTTAQYFQDLGDATDPEETGVQNCFRIGYRNPTDALRAVRKNGEVLGNWMVGAMWAVSVYSLGFPPTYALSLFSPLQPSPPLAAFPAP